MLKSAEVCVGVGRVPKPGEHVGTSYMLKNVRFPTNLAITTAKRKGKLTITWYLNPLTSSDRPFCC